MNACLGCLRRRWLIQQLTAHIDKQRGLIDNIIALSDLQLIVLLAGAHEQRLTEAYANFRQANAEAMREEADAAGVSLVCQHAAEYPDRLLALDTASPSVLSVIGGLERLAEVNGLGAVAIVGTRRPTRYGLAAAQRMAQELTLAGVTVISGLAFGIDSAAHTGALEAGGPTIAVLAGAAEIPYPARKAALFHQVLESGLVISEAGPGVTTWRWALQARNRIIAGLALATVVIEAPQRSGALITVRQADRLERWIGVLPGPVGVTQSLGTNRLLAKYTAGPDRLVTERVRAVRNAQDVLDLVYGEGTRQVQSTARPPLTVQQAALLDRVASGLDNVTRIDATALADLSALEIKGYILRGAGGALTMV